MPNGRRGEAYLGDRTSYKLSRGQQEACGKISAASLFLRGPIEVYEHRVAPRLLLHIATRA